MKTLSKRAGASQFDMRRVEGILVRILLGAIFGFVVTGPFNLSGLLADDAEISRVALQFTEAGIAFLAGLGVKAVYGLFERIIEGIYAVVKPKEEMSKT